MKVKNLTIRIDSFEDDAMVSNRSAETLRLLQGVIRNIRQYGVPNCDGMRLMDSNGIAVGVVTVETE